MLGRMRVLALALLVSSSVAISASTSAAPTSAELAEARARFQQGLALQSGGDWAGALALFEKVAAVAATPQVHFNIGLCHEKLGKLSAALGHYRIAATLAKQSNTSDVEKQATARATDLDARLPKLVITRGANATTAKVFLDGTELGSSALGKEMPVDPGPHQVEARPTNGGKPTLVVADLAERQKKTIELSLETTAPTPEDTPTPHHDLEPPREEKPSRTLAYAGFGVAIAGIAVGSVTGLLMFSKKSDLEGSCSPEKECPPAAHDDLRSANTMATISTIAFIVAGVGAAVGVVGLLTGSSKSSASAKTTLFLGPGGVHGSF